MNMQRPDRVLRNNVACNMDDPLARLEDDPVGNTVHHPFTAHNQGWDAYDLGHDLAMNPYDVGGREHRWWRMGWLEGLDNDDDAEPAAVALVALLLWSQKLKRRSSKL